MQLAGDIGKAPTAPNPSTPNRERKISFTSKLARRLSLTSKQQREAKANANSKPPSSSVPTTPNRATPSKSQTPSKLIKPRESPIPVLRPAASPRSPKVEEPTETISSIQALTITEPVVSPSSAQPTQVAQPSQTISRSLDFIRPTPIPAKSYKKVEVEFPVMPGPVEPVEVEAAEKEDETTFDSQAATNFVFAHFMVGNTYPYTIDNWYDDIKLAAAHGIDGFVLNVGREEWQRHRSADAFAAAKRLPEAINFKFFFSFDMSSIPANNAGDVQLFREYLNVHGKSPRMFRHPRGGIVVSTFSGENSTFGQGSMENGWTYLKNELNKITPIYFIPSFFVNPSRYHNIPSMDGAFNWNGGWPLQLHAGMDRREIQNFTLDSDYSHLDNLGNSRTFMGAVSPWFYTHYGPDTWNKNWIYRGDDWLFVKRWEQLISLRNRIDIAQVISWNDYGESHYIGPIKGAQPNSQAWVDGYDHQGWMHLNAFFAATFKTGICPTVTKDQIYMWARPHPKDAQSADRVPKPNNWQLAEDKGWAIVLATAAGTLEVYTTAFESSKQTFAVNRGLNKISFALTPDGGMRSVLMRDGKAVTACNPIGFRYESRPGVYNFNAFVAMSD